MANFSPLVRHDTRGYPTHLATGDILVWDRFQATLAPVSDNDLTNKKYVDDKVRGFHAKTPCRIVMTTNVNLAAPGTTMDGVTMAVDTRVLLTGQTTASQNGIYLWKSSVSLVRAPDADGTYTNTEGQTVSEFLGGSTVWINGGTKAGSLWQLGGTASVAIGTDAQTWTEFEGVTAITVGTGLLKNGNQLSVNFATSAETTAGKAVQASDTRLSDARTPLAHVHAWSDITTGKPTTLSGYGITDGVATSRTISTGQGLTGGGNLSANRTIDLVLDGTTLTKSATGLKVTDNTFQPLDADLTGIAALANPGVGVTGVPRKNNAGTWSLDTTVYQTQSNELDALAALADTAGFLKKTGNGTYSIDTSTYSVSTHNHSGTYQPLGNELTALQALTDTAGFVKKTGDGTYAIDGSTYLTSLAHTHNIDAGMGLTGGNASMGVGGTATLNVGAGNGIEVNTNDVSVKPNLTKGVKVDVGGVEVNPGYGMGFDDGGGINALVTKATVSRAYAAESIDLYEVATVDLTTGKLLKGFQSVEAESNVAGVAVTNAATSNTPIWIATSGTISMPGLTAGKEYFLGDNGSLVSAMPVSGRVFRIGYGVLNGDGVTVDLSIQLADFGMR